MGKKTTRYARRLANGHATRRSDGITVARMHNTRLTPAEVRRVIDPCKAALSALRQARATYTQWVVLCTACHVATAIEDGGVYRGQRQIMEDASQALDAIGERCGQTAEAWAPRASTGPELTAIADLVAEHHRQIVELTYGEYTRQFDLAVARVRTDGGLVFRAELSGG